MLLKPVQIAAKTAVMSVNTQLAAAHSICGKTRTVTVLVTGIWKGQGWTNAEGTCTQLGCM